MLPAAALLPAAQSAIDHFLVLGRRDLRRRIHAFLSWLAQPESETASPEDAQRRFTMLRLKFNVVLTQFDLFSDVITQRSENETGVWLSGLDVVAARCAGAARLTTRRRRSSATSTATSAPRSGARARACPAAARIRSRSCACRASAWSAAASRRRSCTRSVIRWRRCSIWSIRCAPCCRACSAAAGEHAIAWQLWERWISEIVADFWSVGRVGDRLHHGPHGRGQPAARLRVPAQRRRSAPDPVDPRQAQCSDRRSALPASAVAAP